MDIRPAELTDVSSGSKTRSRLRLLAPVRYLWISHPEKLKHDIVLPLIIGLATGLACVFLAPQIPLFGDNGVLRFTRDLLVMAVPFAIGALATVAMAGPDGKLDRRPAGAELILDGQVLTLREFVCRLLGYLTFLSLLALLGAVAATLLQATVLAHIGEHEKLRWVVRSLGIICLSTLLSTLLVTVLWALYFLTDVASRPAPTPR